ncbi:MAG: hypothetical protein IPH31_17870 [Lewinellaceae bacterium]|nr:hypothetical protein [Lewinellaceae bacterium]
MEYCHPELVQERRFKSPAHALQWHLAKTKINGKVIDNHVNIAEAWKITKGKNITIAIIDDGWTSTTLNFPGASCIPSMRPIAGGPRPKLEDDSHGTSCAGLACAAGLKMVLAAPLPKPI